MHSNGMEKIEAVAQPCLQLNLEKKPSGVVASPLLYLLLSRWAKTG